MAEKRTIELEIQDNSKSLKAQYKEAVAELQKVSAQYGETSAQAVKAAKAAADLKDQIAFSKDLVDAFNPDAKFNALTKSVGGVLDGFQAFEGALGLIGVEGEALQKTMLKVQSAMALSQGLQGLMEAKDSFKQLGTVAGNALKGIKTGIAATGIGLLLVAVGSLVAYWDDIKEAVSGVSDEQTNLNKKTQANLVASEAKVESLNKQDNILKLQGKTEKEILQLKITELDATIKIAEVNLQNQKATKKAQVEAAQRNHDILVGIISFMSIPLELLLKSVDKVASFIGKETGLSEWYKGVKEGAANLIFDPRQTASEGDAAIKEAEAKLLDMKNAQAGYKLQIQQIEREAAQRSISNANQTAKQIKDIAFDLEEERIRLMKDGQQKELDSIALQYARRKKEIEKDETILANDKTKLLNALIDSQKNEEAIVNEKYRLLEKEKQKQALEDKIKLEDEQWYALQKLKNSQKEQELLDLQIAYDKEYELAGTNVELQKTLTDKFNKDSAAINEKYRKQEEIAKAEADKKEADRIKALNDLRFKAAKDTLETISNVTELFAGKSKAQQKKAFQIQKAVNIASATMDTYKAAASALKDSPAPFNYIAMAAVITAGLVNVKKIAAQKFEGGTSGGGGGSTAAGGGGVAPITPQFNTVGNNGINQLAQLQQQPVQAYVVSGEVTSAQALDRNRVQNSSL